MFYFGKVQQVTKKRVGKERLDFEEKERYGGGGGGYLVNRGQERR